MRDPRFYALKLLDTLEEELQNSFDIDRNQLEMTLHLLDGQQYYFNFHAPSEQIWVSSPKTGSYHFYLKENNWVLTKDETFTLNDLLTQEIIPHSPSTSFFL